MATVIKKISELEHLEELTSASNVIIEENGKAKRFSAANLGKVKTVNGIQPDENGNIEVEVGFGGGGVSAQPDWNQNDESAADYVKNRTHYITITDKELLPETLFSNDDEGCAVVDYVDFEGINTATVTYDGKEYVCEVKKETNPNSYMYYLGNRTLGWGGEGAPDTGEPFYVEQWCELFEGEWDRSTVVCAADDSSHTVKIVCAVEDVKKIDENYIPDTIARVSDVEELRSLVGDTSVSEQITEALEGYTGGNTGSSTQSDYNQNDPTAADYIKNRPFYMGDLVETEMLDVNAFLAENEMSWENVGGYQTCNCVCALEEGKKYSIVINGSKYTDIASLGYWEGTNVVGFGDWNAFVNEDYNSVTYAVMYDPDFNQSMLVYISPEAPTECKIYSSEQEILKLDSKYLPEGGVGYTEPTIETPVFNLIQIANDFGAELEFLSSNESDSGRPMFAMEFGGTDLPISIVAGNEYKILANLTSYTYSAIDSSNDMGYPCFWIGDIDAMMYGDFSNFKCLVEIACPDGEHWYCSVAFDAKAFGVFVAENETSYTEPCQLKILGSVVTENIHKIDPKYLPEHIKSDWNENDQNAEGYIANRPFYEAPVAGEVLFEEQTFEDFAYHQFSEPIVFVEGETYFVTFDGEQYECVAWSDEVINSEFEADGVCLGSAAFLGITNKGGNNEPFLLFYGGDFTGLEVENEGTHTIKIQSATLEVAKKIDKKFLPDDIGGAQSDWNQNDETATDYIKNRPFYATMVPDEQLTILCYGNTTRQEGYGAAYDISLIEGFTLVDGETYVVIYDDVRYDCVAYSHDNSMHIGNISLYYNNEETNYDVPFLFRQQNGSLNYSAFSMHPIRDEVEIRHFFKIYSSNMSQKEHVAKIDPKYVSVDWKNVIDKPFNTDVTTLRADLSIRGFFGVNNSETLYSAVFDNDTFNNACLVKMGDDIPTKEQFIGQCINRTYHNYVGQSFNVTSDSIKIDDDMVNNCFEVNGTIGAPFKNRYDGSLYIVSDICVVRETTTISELDGDASITIEPGIWYINRFGDEATVEISYASIKCLDDVYISESIARKGDICWNDLTDQPFGFETLYNFTLDNAIDAIYYDDGTLKYAKFSNESVEPSIFTGRKYKLYDEYGAEVKTGMLYDYYTSSNYPDCYLVDVDINSHEDDDGVMHNVTGTIIIVPNDDTTVTGSTLSKGIWVDDNLLDPSEYGVKSVKIIDSVKTIDEMYIPNTIARVSDLPSLSWNNLTDKPFGDGSKVYEWLPDIEYTEKASMFVKVSDDAPDKSDVIGGKLYVDMAGGGESLQQEAPIEESFVNDLGEGAFSVAEMILVVTADTFDFNGSTLTKGVWMVDFAALGAENGLTYNKIQIIVSGDTKTLDEKYIPDTIARVADIEAMLGNLNSASDKTTYVEWNVNGEYEFAPSPAGDSLVKLSDEVPSADSIVGATETITLSVDGETTTESRVVTADMIVETDYGYVYGYSESSGIYFVTAESATISDTVLTRGVWSQNLAKMSGCIEYKIFKEFVTPKVATAQVGQTIVVKAVDSNGKPIEWECVNLPTDEYINALIDAKLEAISNGTY